MQRDKYYKLFTTKGREDSKLPLCAFFKSAKGCKNGTNCKFSHNVPTSKNPNLSKTASSRGKVLFTSSSVDRSIMSSEKNESDGNDGGNAAPTYSTSPSVVRKFTPVMLQLLLLKTTYCVLTPQLRSPKKV